MPHKFIVTKNNHQCLKAKPQTIFFTFSLCTRIWHQFATKISLFDYTTSTLSSLLTETPSTRSEPPHSKPRDLNVTLSTSHFPISNLGFTLSDALLNLSLSLFRSFAAELAEVKAKLREAEDELVKALAGTHSYISFFCFFF